MAMMKSYRNADLGLLLMRLALGAVFIAHGWAKVQGIEGVVVFFGSLGLPAVLAYVVTAIELVAGIAMVLGAFTGVAGVLLAAVMIGALCTAKLGRPLVGGYELDLALLAMAIGVALIGPGAYSLRKK